jgi:hypothetical protein
MSVPHHPSPVTRTALLAALDEWKAYPERFRRLPPDGRAAFLEGQGYSALRELLGHVIGWWEEGLRVVEGVKADPAFAYAEPDTDAFNAQLVEQFRAVREADALDRFEKTRLLMVDLVRDLTEDLLARPLVRDWLMADVIEHLDEHRLPG